MLHTLPLGEQWSPLKGVTLAISKEGRCEREEQRTSGGYRRLEVRPALKRRKAEKSTPSSKLTNYELEGINGGERSLVFSRGSSPTWKREAKEKKVPLTNKWL